MKNKINWCEICGDASLADMCSVKNYGSERYCGKCWIRIKIASVEFNKKILKGGSLIEKK